MTAISEAKVLIMATDGFEKSELLYPRDELEKAGATVHVAAPKPGEIRSWDHDHWSKTVSVDLAIEQVEIEDYDVLVLPGGQINPDILRTKQPAVELVRDFVRSGKPVAAICHAPWLLVEAGVLSGREATSYYSMRTDVKNAGAHWQDREVVIDGNLITSRSPDDLPAFVAAIGQAIRGAGGGPGASAG